jgi:hypothetical protein
MKKNLEEIVSEISKLDYSSVYNWIEYNVIEVKNNNELVITCGGPSIRIYIDSGVIIGQEGFSSQRVFVDCETELFEQVFMEV